MIFATLLLFKLHFPNFGLPNASFYRGFVKALWVQTRRRTCCTYANSAAGIICNGFARFAGLADLDGDGMAEILSASASQPLGIAGLLAMRLDGTRLWQWGEIGVGCPPGDVLEQGPLAPRQQRFVAPHAPRATPAQNDGRGVQEITILLP